MHPDMLPLAERLVVAMEGIAQDVKKISACVYDLSYVLSDYLNERIKNGGISLLSDDEDVSSPSGSPAAGVHGTSERGNPWHCEQTSESSESYIDDQKRETPVEDDISRSIEHNENSEIVSPLFVQIKSENLSEFEEDASCNVHNVCDDDENTVRVEQGGTVSMQNKKYRGNPSTSGIAESLDPLASQSADKEETDVDSSPEDSSGSEYQPPPKENFKYNTSLSDMEKAVSFWLNKRGRKRLRLSVVQNRFRFVRSERDLYRWKKKLSEKCESRSKME